MAEMIEKLLLISFGLSILITILPTTFVIIDKIEIKEDPSKEIDFIIKELNDYLSRLPNYDYCNQTVDLNFNGTISAFLFNQDGNERVLMMRFSPSGSYNVIYQQIQINFEIEIEINSLITKKYQILTSNNQFYLRFL